MIMTKKEKASIKLPKFTYQIEDSPFPLKKEFGIDATVYIST